jgi:H+/Cl- antiporter ClcA
LGLLSDSTIYGNGSHETRRILQDAHSLPATYFVLKLLATFFSCLSGIPAGLFAPSLAVGAGFGADISMLDSSAPAAAFVLLGIAAYFAGVFQAPLTAVVIVTEMAGSYSMVLPLMAVSLIATATSRLICRRSFYSTMSEKWLERLAPKQSIRTAPIIEQLKN